MPDNLGKFFCSCRVRKTDSIRLRTIARQNGVFIWRALEMVLDHYEQREKRPPRTKVTAPGYQSLEEL